MGLGVFGFSGNALALSCVMPPANLLDRGDGIFLGTVTTIHASTTDMAEYASFTVQKSWKGNVGTKIDVGGIYAWSGVIMVGSTGQRTPFFEVGKSYLVYARTQANTPESRGIPGSLVASITCGSTKSAEAAQEDIRTLNKESASGTVTDRTVAPLIPETLVPSKEPQYPPGTFIRNLTLGSKGIDVIALQAILEGKGYLTMPVGVAKGYFGLLTRRALAQYQQAEGILPALGFFGPKTRAHIQ